MTFISVHSIQSKSVVLTDVQPIRGKKILKAPTTSGHVTLRKTEKLLLKTLKGDSPCDFPSTARKKKTINHSSWHNGAEQRILEFERLWNCHVGKFLCDLVLEDKKFMRTLH